MKLNTSLQKFLNPSIWKHPIVLSGSILLFILGVAYIATKINPNLSMSEGIDSRYFWVAGKAWLNGQNPYIHDIFVETYKNTEFFPGEHQLWGYPPSWAPIACLLALFPFETANLLWSYLNYLALVGIFLLMANWLRGIKLSSWKDSRLWLGGTYCFFLQSVPMVFNLGQTSIIYTFGLVAIFYGLKQKQFLLCVLGIYLLSLKPHIFIIPIIILLINMNWGIVFGGILLIILSSSVAFYISGIFPTIQGFFANVITFTSMDVLANKPYNLGGLINLIHQLNLDFSRMSIFIIGILVAIVFGIIIRRNQIYFWGNIVGGKDTPNDTIPAYFFLEIFILIIALIGFFMPLQIYDYTIYAPLMMIGLHLPWQKMIMICPSLILAFRADNISKITGIYNSESSFPGCFIISIASLLLFIGASINLIRSLRYSNPEL
ncbi:MAG: DUF2029 domain-containing protein [Cyanobacteria bacterium]|nr:DUF2029 domain-containing protein [Cyanobacteria bacterium CG_2015-16_32_12]NCO78478.1 DUF2029 domain-containing protein [Cyanobacteria bacterium CG_2015-22_32_23]NCQ04256.1 DUF2029 domain-containing protein [Cyanobacteria bacterium CG_2015-09_32_10]NCQ40622.1 DUF2029 domain-containing protein [Cyanobacteria bacterium CG_2015-04_32_10]NCS83551.1 DUF2029 domain-containing protein [Cyanobacteria bacterium CG_2015-02_32_10]